MTLSHRSFRSRLPVRPLSIVPIAMAALFCISTSNSAKAQQGRDESTFAWSGQLAAGSMVIIRSGNGPITVRESSSDRVEVRAVKTVRSGGSIRDVAFGVNESTGQVEICALYNGQTSCADRNGGRNVRVRVAFTVLMPKSLRLRMSTGNGEINVERAGADVSASTGNGDVSIGETQGRVDVTTGNGDVHVDGANGPVTVSTGNGRVFVLTARGSVEANTGNGDVDVRIKALPVENDMKFSSGSGAIRVSLPSDFNGRIDASSGNGTLQSEFEISVLGRLDARHVRGTIGSGGPLIRLSTGNGMIELKKG